LPTELIDTLARLLVATLAGMAIGLNRDLQGKPVGMRTLGLVSLGSALVILTSTAFGRIHYDQDAVSRVIQGVLTGVGFLGAGVILRDQSRMKIHGLTTASTVWIAAALGITAGIGAWLVTIVGSAITLLLLTLGGPLERILEKLILGHPVSNDEPRDD
jgi:putative Mg2+ transporter-C (MgtC) family protein